ncbi:hypothetical protein RJ640_014512 [Escallonia rubra]|uniref:Uncharacterized protein n=1 Tax=Escallonia rubra TaxID=112253 RepID=A0AA88UKG1_9ASTE|nr:hypothetical protein RJ640_014512 [Escallonia rubra]
MAEEDLLFNFVDGLQSWAKKELQRRGVKDVDEAIAMAESLTEYDRGGESSKPKWEDEASEGDHANGGGESPKAWHKGDKQASTIKSEGRGKLEEKRVKNKPKDGCFFCGGPHWAKDCRRQGKLAALVKEKDEEKAERESVRIGSIQVLNALQRKNVPQVPTGKGQASKSEGLLYMEAKLNGKLAHVLVDTGATHNFITMGEAERLGLNVVDGGGWLKPVNAEAKPLQGMVRRVEICLGKWKGFVDFSVARMDDFKVVLGLDFLRQVNALVSPYNNAMCIMERGAACVVPLFGGTSSTMTSMRLSDRVVLHEFEKRQPPRKKVGDQGKLDRGGQATKRGTMWDGTAKGGKVVNYFEGKGGDHQANQGGPTTRSLSQGVATACEEWEDPTISGERRPTLHKGWTSVRAKVERPKENGHTRESRNSVDGASGASTDICLGDYGILLASNEEGGANVGVVDISCSYFFGAR